MYMFARWRRRGTLHSNHPAGGATKPVVSESDDAIIETINSQNPVADLSEYELHHLLAHLEHAGLIRDLHTVLSLDTPQRRNAWYEAKARIGDEDGYLDDVNRAWRLVNTEDLAENLANGLGLQCRYALITASLRSRATKISVPLIIMLVQRGVLTPLQGLGYARRTISPGQKVQMLAAIVNYFSEPLRGRVLEEATEIARSIKIESSRNNKEFVSAIAGIAPHLTEPLLRDALEATKQLTSSDQQEALEALAPCLAEPLLSEALEVAVALGTFRTEALAALAPHLAEPLLRQALEAVKPVHGEGDSTARRKDEEAIAVLLPRLAECDHAAEALVLARGIEDEEIRAKALIDIAAKLSESARGRVLDEAVRAARAIRFMGPFRARILLQVAAHANESARANVLKEALAQLDEIPYRDDRLETLASLAGYLGEKIVDRALTETLDSMSLEYEDMNMLAFPRILESLAPHLDELQIRKALGIVSSLPERTGAIPARDEMFEYLVPRLAELGHSDEALRLARRVAGPWREAILERIAANASMSLLREIVSEVERLRDEQYIAEALAAFTPYLSDHVMQDVLRQAIAAVAMVEDIVGRAEAMVAIAPCLKYGYADQFLVVAKRMNDNDGYAKVVAAVIPHVSESDGRAALHDVMLAVRDIRNDAQRAWALSAIAPHLSKEMLAEAFHVAYGIEDHFYRGQALAALVPRLAELGNPREACEIAMKRIGFEWGPEALGRVAPYLSQRLLREIAERATEFADRGIGARVLGAIGPYVEQELVPAILAEADQIWDGNRERTKALTELAPRLTEPLLRQALEIASRISSEENRAEALAGLLPRQAALGSSDEALTAARELSDSEWRARALTALMPYLKERTQQETLEEAIMAAQSVDDAHRRGQLLTGLLPYLQPLPSATLVEEWSLLLRSSSRGTRQGLLSDLAAFAPLIVKLADTSAAQPTVDSILSVGRWWP